MHTRQGGYSRTIHFDSLETVHVKIPRANPTTEAEEEDTRIKSAEPLSDPAEIQLSEKLVKTPVDEIQGNVDLFECRHRSKRHVQL